MTIQYNQNTQTLHTFPTRRSSDLTRSWSALPHAQTEQAGRRHLSCGAETASRSGPRSERACRISGTRWHASGRTVNVFRSEEHTSELQSRENLVCRPLLEKQKKVN